MNWSAVAISEIYQAHKHGKLLGLEEMASKYFMSPRTLRKHLQSSGRSFTKCKVIAFDMACVALIKLNPEITRDQLSEQMGYRCDCSTGWQRATMVARGPRFGIKGYRRIALGEVI